MITRKEIEATGRDKQQRMKRLEAEMLWALEHKDPNAALSGVKRFVEACKAPIETPTK